MAKISFRSLNGVLLLDKSDGVSSNRALQDIKFIYRAKKAGYTGTLDPFATGLLPICFGEANKYSRWLTDADKTYYFKAILGQKSSTGDTEGEISIIDNNPDIKECQLRQVESKFVGNITQVPSKYSAIKIDGQRAYDLARAGKKFIVPKRNVTIYSLSLSVEKDILTGTARVSKGTYIRTLVEDIAFNMGTFAYCKELRRLQISDLINNDLLSQRKMYKIDYIRGIDEHSIRDKFLLPIDILCNHFPKQDILLSHWNNLVCGRQTKISSLENGIVRLYLDNKFCGLGNIKDNYLKTFRLLNTESVKL